MNLGPVEILAVYFIWLLGYLYSPDPQSL